MTLYETLFIVHPERAARVKEFVDRFTKIIEAQGGTLSQVDEWGLRDLAYRIEKQGKGHYVLLRYHATGRAVEELERNLKLTDGILRYLTVRAEENTSTNPADIRGHSEQPRQTAEPDREKAQSVAS